MTLTNDRPILSSERAPHMDRTEIFKQMFGHEPQTGLDTKTDRLTDSQSQCDSDFDLTVLSSVRGSAQLLQAHVGIEIEMNGNRLPSNSVMTTSHY
jgi:hypothetical protein